MILVAIVTAVVLELFLAAATSWRGYGWMSSLSSWMRTRLGDSAVWQGPVGVIVTMLPLLLVILVFQVALADVMFGIPMLLLSIVVLVFCLRFQPLDHLCDVFAESGAHVADGDAGLSEEYKAREAAAEILHCDIPEGPARARALNDVVLVEAHERLFGVVFWFALLGPIGAVLFRYAWLLNSNRAEADGFAMAARRLYAILCWPSARLVAVAYALAGSFEEAVQRWSRDPESGEEDFFSLDASEMILATSGYGALSGDRYEIEHDQDGKHLEPGIVSAAQGLVLRAILVWGVVLVMVSLAGWAA